MTDQQIQLVQQRISNDRPLFNLGRVVATPNAIETLSHVSIRTALDRHHIGDWGNVDAHDFEVNEQALKNGDRLFSVYHDLNAVKFWIITEADRSYTTVLLPEDY